MHKPKVKSSSDIIFEPKITTHISFKTDEDLKNEEDLKHKIDDTLKFGMETLNKNFGEVNPKCPYCSVILKKFPESKTKCRNCGKIFYKRKRPYDNKDILIKENELKIFDKEKKRKNFIKLYSTPDYKFYESELKNTLNNNNFSFEDVIIYKYKEENLKYATLYKWQNYIINNNLLLGIYYNLGRYYEALKCGLENEYLEFCWPNTNINGNGFVNRKEMEECFGKREFKMCDSRLVLFAKKIKFDIEDVQELFLSMKFDNFDDSLLPESRINAWKEYISPGLKKYW